MALDLGLAAAAADPSRVLQGRGEFSGNFIVELSCPLFGKVWARSEHSPGRVL